MAIRLGIIQSAIRVAQIIFCIICLGSSAYWVHWLKHSLWGLVTIAPLNFALFASLTGLIVSSILLIGSLCNNVLAERLPGLIDIILSGLWCIFFLAAGAALGAYGGCTATLGTSDAGLSGVSDWNSKDWDKYFNDMTQQLTKEYSNNNAVYGGRRMLDVDGPRRALLAIDPLCATWDLVIAMCFLCFALYGVSTVLAGLDLKAGKGLVKPKGAASLPATPSHPQDNIPTSTIAINVKEPAAAKHVGTPEDTTAADEWSAAAAPAGPDVHHFGLGEARYHPAAADAYPVIGAPGGQA